MGQIHPFPKEVFSYGIRRSEFYLRWGLTQGFVSWVAWEGENLGKTSVQNLQTHNMNLQMKFLKLFFSLYIHSSNMELQPLLALPTKARMLCSDSL
jgi:hypothetical protein